MSPRKTQALSHAGLLLNGSAPVATSANSRLDAIVVPTARPASALLPVIKLSARLNVPLVILCSRQAQLTQVVDRVKRTFGARALVVQVPDDYRPPCPAPLTSAERFQLASAGRSSDLSAKRNIGLLLGRLRGWSKILFLDDDVYGFGPRDIGRLAGYLDRHPVASMASTKFPDNSVVCHARRIVGFRQDVFVSGATLGVNLKHPELSFFADVYNEDWFFFARHAAERQLPRIGDALQQEYDPFADHERAAREEFGDLLAEGLYAELERGPESFDEHLTAATKPRLWRDFKDDRLQTIEETIQRLDRVGGRLDVVEYAKMKKSLDTANEWANRISPELCADFVDSWQQDETMWQKMLCNLPSGLSNRDALTELQLSQWASCGYGLPAASETNFAAAGAV
ncbi:hypothetical protein [Kribbella sp. NPDC048928]|uniref:hypothetical protein n=1 Tax=Kribbella sp. NPDC048928 TaxID=3364111 RepID=UPI0037153236